MRSASTLMLAALAAVALAGCGQSEGESHGDLVTLRAREVPAAAGHQVDLPTVARDAAGPVRQTLGPSSGTRLGQLVRILSVRADGDRLVLTVGAAKRARGAQSVTDPATDQHPDPLPPGGVEVPTAPGVTVTGHGAARVGPDAVRSALERAGGGDDARWEVFVRDGQVVELRAEPAPGG